MYVYIYILFIYMIFIFIYIIYIHIYESVKDPGQKVLVLKPLTVTYSFILH